MRASLISTARLTEKTARSLSATLPRQDDPLKNQGLSTEQKATHHSS